MVTKIEANPDRSYVFKTSANRNLAISLQTLSPMNILMTLGYKGLNA